MAFDGTLKFDTAIDQAGFKLGLDGLGGIAKAGMQAVTSAVTAAAGIVSDLGAKAIDAGKGFESSMAQVIATMGITKDTVEDGINSYELLKAAAAEAGENTTFSASEAADALNYLALAGYDAVQAADALPAVLDLAAAGNLDLAYASDLATDAMSALGIAATKDNLTHFGDQLAKTASKANTSVAQLGEAILTVGGTAKNLAGGTTELNAALGVLANAGIKGSEGGTALRNIMLAMTPTTDKAVKAFERLSLESYDADGNLRPLNETFRDLNNALSGMTSQEKTNVLNDIFNKVDLKSATAMLAACASTTEELGNAFLYAGIPAKSLTAFLENFENGIYNAMSETDFMTSVMDDFGITSEAAGAVYSAFVTQLNGLSFENLYNEISDCDGAMAQMAETMNDTLEGDMKSLGSKAEALGIAVYDAISTPLRDLAQLGGTYISQLTDAFKEGGFEGLAEALGDVLGQAVMKIEMYQPAITEIGASVITSLMDGLAQNAVKISHTAFRIFAQIADTAAEILPDLEKVGAKLITTLIHGLIQKAPAIANAGLSAGLTLIDGFFGITADLISLGTSLLVTLADSIQEKLPEITETAQTIIERMTESLSENLPLFLTAGASIIGCLASILMDNLPLIVESALTIIKSLCDTLLTGDNLQKLLDAGMQILMAVTQAITENLPLMIDIALQIILFLCEELLSGENILALVDTAAQILIALVDAISENTDEILLAVEEILRTLCDELTSQENLTRLIEIGTELLAELIVGICKIGGQLVGFALILYDEIQTELREMDWDAIGTAIVEGICSGLLGCDFILDDYLSDFGSNWLNGIKEIFGIHSPSKLMEEVIGKNLALGIGIGFTEELPDVGMDAVRAFAPLQQSIDAQALSAFRMQSLTADTGLARPSATSEVVNNHYSYTTVNHAAAETRTGGETAVPNFSPTFHVQIGNEEIRGFIVSVIDQENAITGGVTF